jgi:hypothetical protein
MTGALEIEQHARNLHGEHTLKNASCISKHALLMRGHANEAISHSAIVAPEKTVLFQEIATDIENFRKTLEKTRDPKVIIQTIRDVRKKIEKTNPDYNLSECKVCGLHTPTAEFIKENTHDNIQGPKMQLATIAKEAIGGAIVAKGADLLVSKVSVLQSNKQIANVGLGLAAVYLGTKAKVPDGALVKDSLKAGGVFLITKEIYSLVSGYTSTYGFGGGLAYRQAVPVMPAQMVRSGGSVIV